MRDGVLRQRSADPGTKLHILVLAPGRKTCLGVDLDTGTFVRAHQPSAGAHRLRPFDVTVAITAADRAERPEQPESVDVEEPLAPVGQLRGWRLERMLRHLAHPAGRPLLGFHGTSIPVWSLDFDRPSVALVEPGADLRVLVGARGTRCQFLWNGLPQDVAFEDPRLLRRLDWLPDEPLQGRTLRRVLGFAPHRLVVALSRPMHGHCYKVAAAALPRA